MQTANLKFSKDDNFFYIIAAGGRNAKSLYSVCHRLSR